MLNIYRAHDRLPIVEWPYAIVAAHERDFRDDTRVIDAEIYVFMLTNGKISAKSSQTRSYRWRQPGPTVEKGLEFVRADTLGVVERVIEKWQFEAYKKLDIPFLHSTVELVEDARVFHKIALRDVVREQLRDIGDETRIEELREFLVKYLTIGEIAITDSKQRS